MSGFDIENLLKFEPARNWCPNCLALWEDYSYTSFIYGKKDYKSFVIEGRNDSVLRCKSCGIKFVSNEDDHKRIIKFIENDTGFPLKNVEDTVEHGRRLALISQDMRAQKSEYPPLKALLMALVEARSFIHFTSWGITQMMIGVLKVAAQRVPVRGIVSGNLGEQILCELNDFNLEAPLMMVKYIESVGFRTTDIPHQKLVVIDGLLAFKGSANFTQMAWRSAVQGTEIIEVVSNINEVVNLHNQFFSPMWAKMKGRRERDEIRI